MKPTGTLHKYNLYDQWLYTLILITQKRLHELYTSEAATHFQCSFVTPENV